jgi:hypothetical protein
MDGPIAANTKIQIRKIKILKIADSQKSKAQTFIAIFPKIDREIVSRKIAFLFSRSAADFRLFVSLCSDRTAQGAKLMRASNVPMRRQHPSG